MHYIVFCLGLWTKLILDYSPRLDILYAAYSHHVVSYVRDYKPRFIYWFPILHIFLASSYIVIPIYTWQSLASNPTLRWLHRLLIKFQVLWRITNIDYSQYVSVSWMLKLVIGYISHIVQGQGMSYLDYTVEGLSCILLSCVHY